MKDKKGILVSINYEYLINKDIKKHILSVSPMVLKNILKKISTKTTVWAENMSELQKINPVLNM